MIYVDKGRLPYKRMKMSHVTADTMDELLRAMVSIGVDVKHLQSPVKRPHFDICQSKRQLLLTVNIGNVQVVSSREIITKSKNIQR